jgi:hypothetical protein
MKGLVRVSLALIVAAAVAYPISREWSARGAIQHGMINSLDANDAAALRAWPGSAESFVAMLHDRCMRAHGGDATACTRYHTSSD